MCCRKISKSVRLCVFCCADVDDRKLQVLRLDLWILFRSRQIEDHRAISADRSGLANLANPLNTAEWRCKVVRDETILHVSVATKFSRSVY